MAIDTAAKRYSALNPGAVWRGPSIFPSGSVDAAARRALDALYSGLASSVTWQYVTGSDATYNGDGTAPNDAASPGGVGAFNTLASGFTTGNWRMVAGRTLNIGGTGLTTGHDVVIEKYGSGANPIITGTASTLLNSTTANVGPQISDINFVRSGGVSGTGLQMAQTTGTTLTRCTIRGSQTNVAANNAVSLTVDACTLGGGGSTEYGVRTTSATTDCSGWSITGNTFNTGVGVELQVSNSSNAAGKYSTLVITGNTFPASAGGAIVMQSPMNLTTGAHTLQVTGASTIVITGGTWPAWNAGQTIFLSGFANRSNFGQCQVVSIVGSTLTISGLTLTTEADGTNKGAWLVDSTRAFIAPEIGNNVLTGQQQTPMLLASFIGGRIHHNSITDATAAGTALAAAIELGGCSGSLVVDYNSIDNISVGALQQVDAAGIFTDGGCDGVTVSNNTISRCAGRAGVDNSGQGTGFYFAQNCVHEYNTVTSCYRGTWAGGIAGAGNTIRSNRYFTNDIAIDIDCPVAANAFTIVGNTFSGNRIDLFDCPNGITTYGATPRGAGYKAPKKRQFFVEIDEERFLVDSIDEGLRLLAKAKEAAEANAREAVAKVVKQNPKTKAQAVKEVRKWLQDPKIIASFDIAADAKATKAEIKSIYRAAVQTVEMDVTMRRTDDNDDEEVLMLLF